MTLEKLDPKSTALLLMDFQNDIVGMVSKTSPALLASTARLLEAARANKFTVVYVTVAFRESYAEASPRNKGFSQVKAAGRLKLGSPGAAIHEALAPRADEPVVVKKRISAFAGSDLEIVLRSQRIETLLLTGISTSGVVLSTVRASADLDYRLIVVKDCCADGDEEVHRVLTEKVFVRQADVVDSAEVLTMLRA